MIVLFLSFCASRVIDEASIQDPYYPKQFAISNKGEDNGISGEDLNVIPIWTEGYSGEDTKITIIDTGFNPDHIEFKTRIQKDDLLNFDKQNNQVFTTKDASQDATSSVGVAAAEINNNGIVGISPDSKISATAITAGKTYNYKDIIEIYQHKTSTSDVVIIPFHISGQNKYSSNLDFVETIGDLAVNNEDNAGVVFINAAGDHGHEGADPNMFVHTCSRYSMTVGASTNRGAPAYYSNSGACISVSAPASGLSDSAPNKSMDLPNIPSPDASSNEQTIETTGRTAYAAGAVGGVASLLRSIRPEISAIDLQTIIQATATKTDPENPLWKQNAAGYWYHPQLGLGRVNAEAAMKVAKSWSQADEYIEETESPMHGPYFTENSSDASFSYQFSFVNNIRFVSYVELTFNTEDVDMNSAYVDVTSPKGTEFTVMWPSAFNMASETHSIKTDKSLNSVRVGARCFFGEAAEGNWTVSVRLPHANLEDTINLTATFYGYLSDPYFAEFEKQKASPSAVEYTNKGSLALRSKAQCGPVNVTFKKTDEALAAYLVSGNEALSLGTVDFSESENATINFPCVQNPSGKVTLALRNPLNGNEYSTSVSYQTPKEAKVITDPRKLVPGENTITWSYDLKHFPPIGVSQQALLLIDDLNESKTIIAQNIVNNGYISVELPNLDKHKIQISILPRYESIPGIYAVGIVGEKEQTFPEQGSNALIIISCVTSILFLICMGVGFFVWKKCRKYPEEATAALIQTI